ncbi:hypothetical protein ANN_06866 [Periplaneta americana]|uniref:Uncharacterized protein n=1 Tax=Periplaneta americana TaxID=6978 RepID=A0ABQ8TH47_PERAM|nr:hypothetical protein ANN_06866 [Periplaneta americana]
MSQGHSRDVTGQENHKTTDNEDKFLPLATPGLEPRTVWSGIAIHIATTDNSQCLELNALHQLLVYAYDMNMLGENPQTIRENTEILLEVNKAIGLEVNPEKKNLVGQNTVPDDGGGGGGGGGSGGEYYYFDVIVDLSFFDFLLRDLKFEIHASSTENSYRSQQEDKRDDPFSTTQLKYNQTETKNKAKVGPWVALRFAVTLSDVGKGEIPQIGTFKATADEDSLAALVEDVDEEGNSSALAGSLGRSVVSLGAN